MKILLVLLCSISFCAQAAESPKFSKEASLALIKRLLPEHAKSFEVEYISQESNKDVFELESKGRKVVLRGSNGISVASALNYYLKNYAHYDVGWNTAEVHKLPDNLPTVKSKIRKATPYQYRYSLNYCTFNYSASWWKWDRWERAIDWMALNGINMPLALTGQNSVWYRVYREMGFSEEELKEFFPGPAYFNWFWMGNLDGWAGPLSQSFMQKHQDLQKKILARERELGMKPILPAFTGHVPRSFKKHYPQANLFKVSWGDDFPSVAFAYVLDPNDSLFTVIGNKFIKEQTKTFGTDHLYSADTFNEMVPPSNDSTFLDNISKKIYQSMASADPEATWIMQGWMFSYKPDFWAPKQMKALLNAVPDDKLIILDLWSEILPVWESRDAFYGKPWIWCMLHNFGGTNSLYGDLDRIASWPSETLHNPKSGNMAGIGLTMEAIEQNPVVYSLMLENVWRDTPVDLSTWITQYALQRYGKSNKDAGEAWKILKATAYGAQPWWGTASIVTGRPTFDKEAKWTRTDLHYNPGDLLPAWKHLTDAADDLKTSDGFQYDLVDLSRQVMANYANHLQQQFAAAYQKKDYSAFEQHSARFLELIDDMDKLLATRKDFLLGKWLNDSKSYGDNLKEKQLFEQNARDLITVWGDKDCGIHDYAHKQWSGMLKGYYKPRWQKFFSYVNDQRSANRDFHQKDFEEIIKQWEWEWVNKHDSYPDRPSGNPITVSKEMYKKYAGTIASHYLTTPPAK